MADIGLSLYVLIKTSHQETNSDCLKRKRSPITLRHTFPVSMETVLAEAQLTYRQLCMQL